MKRNGNTNSNTGNADLEKLKGMLSDIRQNFEALGANEKSSADKSYVIGRNLTELHKENRYRQLKDEDGNCFKKWQDFCEKGCGFSRVYADKLMKSAAIQDRLEASEVTTIKQSVANLYRLHIADKKPSIDIKTVWQKATKDNPDAFPTRNAVLKAITPHAQGNARPNAKDKFIKELSDLELTVSERKVLNAIIKKWIQGGMVESPEEIGDIIWEVSSKGPFNLMNLN